MTFFDQADPFHGNGTIDLPVPQGIAASWFFLKAQTGNTHPGACLPFGMVSACPYSGAYVTGYGLNGVNTHGNPPQIYDTYTATGFTHFHQGGTGYTGIFYNYVKVMPLRGGMAQIGARHELEDEQAVPGFYSTVLKETGIKAEPAFANHFNITGDPYQNLYNMYNLTDKELKKISSLIL